jgi:PIN domain nuclease of toxin-antitoxin system
MIPTSAHRLSSAIGDANNQVLVSMVSLWEIAIKYGLGKLSIPEPPDQFFPSQLAKNSIRIHNISSLHAFRAGNLTHVSHKDPFDRMLLAQSLVDQIPLVSNEVVFDDYGISRIW